LIFIWRCSRPAPETGDSFPVFAVFPDAAGPFAADALEAFFVAGTRSFTALADDWGSGFFDASPVRDSRCVRFDPETGFGFACFATVEPGFRAGDFFRTDFRALSIVTSNADGYP